MTETLKNYMEQLSGVCDGAKQADGMGFSKPDSYNGHYLASLPTSEWGKEEISLASFYAIKYSRQLSLSEQAIEALKKESDKASKEKVTNSRRKKYNKGVKELYLSEDGKYIIAKLSKKDPGFVEDSRTIKSRFFDWDNYTTRFSIYDMDAVLKLADKYELEVKFDPASLPKASTEVKESTNTYAKKNIKKVCIVDNKIYVYFPYSKEEYMVVSSIPSAKFPRKNNEDKHWEIDPTHARTVVSKLESRGYEISPEVSEAAQEMTKVRENATLNYTDFSVDVPQLNKEYKIMRHQWVPVELLMKSKYKGLLVADSQGLGKTFSSLLSAVVLKSKRTVVVSPAGVVENWIKEAHMFFEEGTFNTAVLEGRKTSPIPEDINFVVLSWDVFKNWKETLDAWEPEMIIMDEGHYGKSGSGSQRGEAYISFGAQNKNAYKIVLSGTPMTNRPLELLASLRFLGAEKLFGGITKYKNRYCGPKEIKAPPGVRTFKTNAHGEGVIVTYMGASNTSELNEILTTSGIYLRRTKQLLKDEGSLKNKYVNGVEFFDYNTTPSPTKLKLNPSEMSEYHAVEEEFSKKLREQANELAIALGLHPSHPKVLNAVRSNKGGESLVLLGEFRKKVGLIKMRAVKEAVQELVDKGEKVVIFAHHREVVDEYARVFGGLKIQGGMSRKAVQEAKRKFNETPVEESPVLVCSIEAAATGHTFFSAKHKDIPNCRYIIFAEEPFVYGTYEQAQDRVYRIGQDRDVYIINMIVPDTVDESIYTLREKKRIAFSSIIDGVEIEGQEEENISKEIIKDYI